MENIVYIPKYQSQITENHLKELIDQYPASKIHLKIPLVINNIFMPCPTMPELYSKDIFKHITNSWKNYIESFKNTFKNKFDFQLQGVWSLHDFVIELYENDKIDKVYTDYKLYFTRLVVKHKYKNNKITFM